MSKVIAVDTDTISEPSTASSVQIRKRGLPLFVVMGLTSVVFFLALCLSVLFVVQYYGHESVKELQLLLRARLPTEVRSSLELKLEVLPGFMRSTLNQIEGMGIDVQTWEGQTRIVDILVSFLVTFPPESRCCSGFILLPKDADRSRVRINSPDNDWSIVSFALVRPGGIQWFHNGTDGTILETEHYDRLNRTTELISNNGHTSAVIDSSRFSSNPYPIDQPIEYTPTVVWNLDDYQLKLYGVVPVWKRAPGRDPEWIGTYAGGFKLGFLGGFLRGMLREHPSWSLYMVDTAPENRGVLLASSFEHEPVLTCYNPYRCDPGDPRFKNEFSPCVPCKPGETPRKILAVNSRNKKIRESSLEIVQHLGTWSSEDEDTVDLDVKLGGTKYLVSSIGLRTRKVLWAVVLLVPRSDVFGKLDEGERMGSIVSSCMIVLGIICFVALSFALSHPISKLSKKLIKVSTLDLDAAEEVDSSGGAITSLITEFGIFDSSFTYMIDGLREYRAYVPTAVLGTSRKEIEPPSGDVALVFTDIEGSTRLWNKNAIAMNTALELHNEAIRSAIDKHNGYEVKTIGDAFMVAFSKLGDALKFCVKAQLALGEQDWPLELEFPEGGMRVRMGCMYGPTPMEENPITGRADYRGPTVNQAARLESKANGGTICLTAALASQHPAAFAAVSSEFEVETKAHGKQEMKGIGSVNCTLLVPKAFSKRLHMAEAPVPFTPDNLESSAVKSTGSGGTGTVSRYVPDHANKKTNLSLATAAATVAACKLKPRTNPSDLYELCAHMVRAVIESAGETNGVVLGTFGQMVTVVWNTAVACKAHVLAAMRFATQLKRRVKGICTLGLATGGVHYGNVGTAKSRFSTVFGLPVLVASAAADHAAVLDAFAVYAQCVGLPQPESSANNTSRFLRMTDVWKENVTGQVIYLHEVLFVNFIRSLNEETDDPEARDNDRYFPEQQLEKHSNLLKAHIRAPSAAVIENLRATRDGDRVLRNLCDYLLAAGWTEPSSSEPFRVLVTFSSLPHGVPTAIGRKEDA